MAKIKVKEIVLGTHHWNGAEGAVEFLKHEHHHDFHIYLTTEVAHDDREIEFIQLRLELKRIMATEFTNVDWIVRFGPMSCEMIAKKIKMLLELRHPHHAFEVGVFEDDIMGGIV